MNIAATAASSGRRSAVPALGLALLPSPGIIDTHGDEVVHWVMLWYSACSECRRVVQARCWS